MKKNMNKVGYGTWLITEEKDINFGVKTAVENGYFLIDTAQVYNNESFIGNLIEKGTIDLSKVFITSKVFGINFRYHTYKSVQETLRRLKIKKIDLMLLHSSVSKEDNLIAYRELVRAREDGLVDRIGVSNWRIQDIQDVYEATGEYPYVNQVIASPLHRMIEIEKFCTENNILLTAYSTIKPYFHGEDLFNKEKHLNDDQKKVIDLIAEKHSASPAEILLCWIYKKGYAIIPKSLNKDHIIDNLNSVKINLSNEDISKIDNLRTFGDKQFDEIVEKNWPFYQEITDKEFKQGLLFDKTFDWKDFSILVSIRKRMQKK